jgi:hypothetical protein
MHQIHLSTCFVVGATFLLPAVAGADVVIEWNEIALAQVVAAKQLPPDQSRTMAMVHVAMFDAVNAVERRYTPYKVNAKAAPGASMEAAAAAAARAILVKLYPNAPDAFEKAYTVALASIQDGEGKSAGIAVGEAAAAEIYALRAADGTGAPTTYRPFTAGGVYVPTVLPVNTDTAAVKPWIMGQPAQFRPGPPPALTSKQWAQDYNEVKDLGGKTSAKRTPEQTDIARFWALTGPATWNPIMRQLAAARNLSLIENARLFALVHMAGADAFIAVFDAKYAYNFWRPITAIRNGDIDSNDATERDPGWLPLIDTPMHPEYPCAHCITSSAVGTVLIAEFGSGQVAPITMTSPTAPAVTRKWERIADYVEEVSNARIWAGIHYRTSAQVGQDMGRDIGRLVTTTSMRPGAAR